MISLATSDINEEVRANVQACLDEGRIGSGRFVIEFEEKAQKLLQVKHAIAVCNGTMADMVAVASLRNIRPDRNEVIVPALTFIAHPNSVLINGLIPIFVDVRQDFQIDVETIEEKITPRTLAIFPVHLLGKCADMDKIVDIARKHDIFIIEDCCEAWGAKPDKFVGTYGDFGTFSFFPSHTITTGEGGMVITNSDILAEYARKARNHGRRSQKVLETFHFDFIGFNGKMNNLSAAVGCGTIGSTEIVVEKRRKNIEIYNELLDTAWYADSPHCYPYGYASSQDRDKALLRLEKHDVEGRKLFSCIPRIEYKIPGSYPVADEIGEKWLFVPVHQNLSREDIVKVCSLL